jgi:hypothetical protein
MFHYDPPIHTHNSYCVLPWRLLTTRSINFSSPPTSDTHRATCKKIGKMLHISCPMYPLIYEPYHAIYIINTAYVTYKPLLPNNEVFRYFCSKTNQMHNISNLFYFGIIIYMFRTASLSIIRNLRLYIQHKVYVIQILWLLASHRTCMV